ncbi:DUF2911 domain-containing protein [Horticoccus sp. 23ND18S-11]|uniref:DUF2911 domain-containing protein n=1 Tax=Horticoccus sp. 23ND18S-11 TaxID=3391832 RepID=UPI0039C94CBB
MKTTIKSSLIAVIAAFACAAPLVAQSDTKAPAPKKQAPPPPIPGAGTGGNTVHATTSAVIGPNRNEGNMITISYGRPTAVHPRKGGEPRKIWGGLVPWGKADRMGADEATSLITQKAIDVGGTTIPAGVYTLYIIPQETGASKLAFSKSIGKWGVPVDESNDLARVDLKKEDMSEAVNQLTISVENTPRGSMNGVIKIKWEKTQFSLPFTVKS